MTSRADSLTHEDLQMAKKNAESNIVAALQKQARLRYAGYEGASLEWRAASEIDRLRADLESECERRDEIIASETHLRKQAEIDRDHYKSIYENAQMEAVTAFASGFEAAKEMAAGIVSSLSLDRAETAEAIRSMEKPHD